MRKSLVVSAALVAASMASGYAQTTSGQTPPAPAAGSQPVQPPNSMPPSSGTLSPTGRGIRPAAGAAAPSDTGAAAGGGSVVGNGGTAEASPRRPVPGRRHYARPQPSNQTYMDPENPGGGRAPAD
ncbi:MAG: hypothetical protein JOZ05_13515, partial [Acetobacteraceae bacterium]|nr:hypothetical protein [Acetobacteraceae bacterium]